MLSGFLVLLLAVFISGGVLGVFATLLAGIHAEERRMSLTHSPQSRTAASTRRLLGVTVRPHSPHTTTLHDEKTTPHNPTR
ncbi:hypothetical protein Arub01_22300 [Actinomadura rubrobrunea]|uniref:Uncharacterized protein n=1 Tax=Actinomadura rubrobrunea TaxID=115335 RepID=A0A9W6PVJ4_9ACTN|nr:hypothetical protein [Actinomadura rubrobrunea]GLW63986.1 hypothetical protein Arub01_22300 [Actinomadura rubrobrunea]